ncbi:UNVERIFIED_CONTAM: hypothetical protein FKN15_018448 [Acipenser sinensis]
MEPAQRHKAERSLRNVIAEQVFNQVSSGTALLLDLLRVRSAALHVIQNNQNTFCMAVAVACHYYPLLCL